MASLAQSFKLVQRGRDAKGEETTREKKGRICITSKIQPSLNELFEIDGSRKPEIPKSFYLTYSEHL